MEKSTNVFAEYIWVLVVRECNLRMFTKRFGGPHCLSVDWSSWGSPAAPEDSLGAPKRHKLGHPTSLSSDNIDGFSWLQLSKRSAFVVLKCSIVLGREISSTNA